MRRAFTCLCVAVAFTLFCAVACSSTAGVPVDVTFFFEGEPEAVFTTASGWDVELTEARALVGPVYVYETLAEEAGVDLLRPARAFAHGGFDPLEGRRILVEVLEQRSFDALRANAEEIATVEGLAGTTDSATLILDAPTGELADDDGPTHGHHLWVAGIARKDDVEITFEGGLDLPVEMERRVSGVLVDPVADLTEGSHIVLRSRPSAWLAEADFSALTIDDDGGARITPGSQPARAFFLGPRSAASWSVGVEGGER